MHFSLFISFFLESDAAPPKAIPPEAKNEEEWRGL
jgi:hypothetical protein